MRIGVEADGAASPEDGSVAPDAAAATVGSARRGAAPEAEGAADPSPDGPLASLMLQTWLSPAFPVGAFAYSHGLEWAVEDGSVADLAGLVGWLDGIVRHGAGRSDAILLAHAWRAVTATRRGHESGRVAAIEIRQPAKDFYAPANEPAKAPAATVGSPAPNLAGAAADPAPGEQADPPDLVAVAELAEALQPTRERRLEAIAQGEAFLKAARATWPQPGIEDAAAKLAGAGLRPAYPVAVGVAAAAHGVPLALAAAAYVQAFAANLASAAVRLVPLGQTDGQRAVAALTPVFIAVAAEAVAAPLAAIGGATLRADIASARHETQYTRLFRS